MARQISKEILINSSEDQVFQALITPSKIRSWWQADRAIILPKKNGIYVIAWGEKEDQPDFITAGTIKEYSPNKRLLLADFDYFSSAGPLPFEAKFEILFTLTGNGTTSNLTVLQTGIPDLAAADEYFEGCLKGWTDTLNSLKKVVEHS